VLFQLLDEVDTLVEISDLGVQLAKFFLKVILLIYSSVQVLEYFFFGDF